MIYGHLNDLRGKSFVSQCLEAQHPDKFILGLIENSAQGILDALNTQVRSMISPPLPMVKVLENLEDNGLTRSVPKLRDLLK